MLIPWIIAFKNIVCKISDWVTCGTLIKIKNGAVRPHPPIERVQTSIFGIPLGRGFKMIHVCKNPEMGGGFHFLAHGLKHMAAVFVSCYKESAYIESLSATFCGTFAG